MTSPGLANSGKLQCIVTSLPAWIDHLKNRIISWFVDIPGTNIHKEHAKCIRGVKMIVSSNMDLIPIELYAVKKRNISAQGPHFKIIIFDRTGFLQEKNCEYMYTLKMYNQKTV